jgi:hypothetical protein
MQVRELKVKDLTTVIRIVEEGKLLTRFGEGGKFTIREILTTLLELEPRIKAWMADMANLKDAQELDELPVGAFLDIIESIANQEGVRDFFGRLSRALNIKLGDMAKNSVKDTAGQTSTLETLASSDMPNSPEKS